MTLDARLQAGGAVARITLPPRNGEAVERFACFGGRCGVLVTGFGPGGHAPDAARLARRRMLGWHAAFSRFEPDSELSRLNRDPAATVAVSPEMARFVAEALAAAEHTGGLVDPTLTGEIERAGYAEHFDSGPVPLRNALALAPPRAAASARRPGRWREVSVDQEAGTVTRPPGVRLDSGGLAKGLFGDLLAVTLDPHESFAVDASGDVRFGGRAGVVRPIEVASPFDESILHVFRLTAGAAATSGIGRRSWLDGDGRPAHHLLDPATGRPAFTGVVQVTALAPTGVRAEALSKVALFSGPERAAAWLVHGGVIVRDDGSCEVVEPQGL